MMAFNGFPSTYHYQPAYPSYQPIGNNSLTWVSGEAGAKSYLVSPNATIPLFDSESQTIYIKSADASGMPSIKVLDYTVRETAAPKPPIAQPTTDYASTEELNALKRELDALRIEIERISNGKSDTTDKSISTDAERQPSGFT